MAGITVGSVAIDVVPSVKNFGSALSEQLLPQADAIGVEVGQHISDGIRESLKDISVNVTADTTAARTALTTLTEGNWGVNLGFDDSRIVEALEEISAKLDELNDETTNIRLELEDGTTKAGLDEVSAKLDDIGDRKVSPKVSLDNSQFNAQIDETKAKLDALKAESAGGDGFGLGIPVSGMGAGIAGALAASPSFPGALTGAATGLGTLGLAYEGISGALSAYQDQSQKAATSTGQTASAALSASNTIRTAQQAVSSAVTQEQHDSVTSAEAIKNAQTALAQAQAQAAEKAQQDAQAVKSAQQGVADAVRQADQQQTQAEQQLQQAQYAEQQAQVSLTQARQQAILTLQSLNDASQDAVLGAKQASLDLQQAQLSQQQTDKSSTSTALEKEQAALSVAEAQQRLVEANQSQTNSTKAANDANKAGVSGSQAVQSAEHNLAQAKQATANAQRGVTSATVTGNESIVKAEQALTTARQTSARDAQSSAQSIAKAQQSVADAERSASWQQQADAKAVANAQASLKYAYASAAAGAKGGSKSANEYAQALAKLSTPQAAMVKGIVGFENQIKKLEGVADKAIAPGVTKFLNGLEKLLPKISPEISKMGGIISGFMSEAGKDMGSKGFQSTLKSLFDEGNKFVKIVGPALGKTLGSFLEMGAKSAPAVTGLAKGIAGIADGFSGFFKALTPSAPAIGKVLNDIGQIVADIGPPIGAMFGGIITALEPLLTGLLPTFKTTMKSLTPVFTELGKAFGKTFGETMKDVAPLLGQMAKQFAQLMIKMLPLVPPLTKLGLLFVDLLMKGLTPMVDAVTDVDKVIVTVIGDIVKWRDGIGLTKREFTDAINWLTDFGNFIGNLFTKTIPGYWDDAIGFLNTKFVQPIEHGLSTAWNWVVANVGTPIHNFFTQTIPGYWDTSISFLKSKFVTPFQNALKDAWTWVQTNVMTPIHDFFLQTLPGYFSTAVTDIGKAWNKLGSIMQTPVKWVVNNVIDKLISAFDWVSSKVGGPNIKPFKFAEGAKVPGGYGGGDIVPALLEPGETVVPKHLTPAVAPLMAAHGVPGFANGTLVGGKGNSGGLLGTIGSTIGGIVGKVEDALDIMRLITSGNASGATGALMKMIGTGTGGAVADMAGLLSGVTTSLVKSAVNFLIGAGGSGLGDDGSAIVKYAESFIGKVPYVYGGTSLSTGIDCSAFVQKVYEHFGIDAPRTSEQQWDWVKKSSPTPGGLAFFAGSDGTASSPGHVGIVVDSNKMVDAYTTGTDVMFNSIQGSSGAISGYGTPPGGLGGGTAAKGDLIANAATIGAYLRSHGASKIAAAGIMGNMLQESGGNWDIGGGGLIQITGAHPTSLSESLAETLSYISANGGMGPINAAKSVAQATEIFMSKYERPAVATENLARRLAGASAAYSAGYDGGGYLAPGMTLAINGTGRPEPVFTGRQWDTLSAAVGGGGGDTKAVVKAIDRMHDTVKEAPARTGAHVSGALNDVARGARQRAYTRTR